MAIFHWKGMEGSETKEGDIEAPNQDEAMALLQQQGVIPTEVTLIAGDDELQTMATDASQPQQPAMPNQSMPQAPSAPPGMPPVPPKKPKAKQEDEFTGEVDFKPRKVANKDLIVFTKKLATMIESGLPILKTLQMLRSQAEDPNIQKIIHHIYKSVESGSTLSEAFMNFPDVFDTVYINLLKAGETSGKLTLFLHKLTIQIEKSEKIRSKVKKALMYPTILVCVAIGVIAIMMIKVVPVFAGMFSSMGGSLPGPTQLIIDISDFLREPAQGGLLAGVIVFAYISFKYSVKHNVNIKRKADAVALKLPILGEIIQKSTLSKIAMVEGNLSAAGVAVLENLEIVSKSVTSELYRDAFVEIRQGIAEGKTLSSLYAAHEKLFPPTFSQMLAVGEETGNMDEMFESTARYYEEEFDETVDRLTELLEPIMIVFMGITVGFIIVAMYMPIFQIGQIAS